MTRLCVALTEPDTESLLAAMHDLPTGVDLVEVRLDFMKECELQRVCESRDRPIIVTNRPTRQGGHCEGPEDVRLRSLRQAAELGADYIDVELDSVGNLGALPGTCGRIVSHHDFQGTPPDLDVVMKRIIDSGADIGKIVPTASRITDVAPMLDLLRRHAPERKVIALSMGEAGLVSRILCAKFGAYLTFASRERGAESAPGQVPYDEMLDMYRLADIGPDTRVYGVVANPVAHSMSPAVHNAAFGACDIDAVYLPFKVDNAGAFLSAFRPYDLNGLSVTLPHKETMLALMDEVDEEALRIGAINTVACRGERLLGRNTDIGAAVSAIEDAVRRSDLPGLDRCKVLIVGAGGAARAMACGLKGRCGRIVVANRTVSRAAELASEFGLEHCGLDGMGNVDADVIANTTSVGMWPNVDETPVPAELLHGGMVVFDAVYNPLETRLLSEAGAAGAMAVSGIRWFLNQAVAQFEWWTEQTAPADVMEQVVRQRLQGE